MQVTMTHPGGGHTGHTGVDGMQLDAVCGGEGTAGWPWAGRGEGMESGDVKQRGVCGTNRHI